MEFSTLKLLNRCKVFHKIVVLPVHTVMLYQERRRNLRHFLISEANLKQSDNYKANEVMKKIREQAKLKWIRNEFQMNLKRISSKFEKHFITTFFARLLRDIMFQRLK